jgi:hypothetical protein
MKSFKSIREGNYAEPGVSAIDDAPEDPMSFIEIKPKKTKVVKGDLKEAVSVKKEKHSWGTMMTVHHGSDTSYPLHPEHQSAIKKLRPGMKTTFKDETNSTVHAHREDNTIHLSRPKTGSTVTALPYHHFDTSEHAKPAAKKPAGEYDRKVSDHLKKKYNEDVELEEGIKSKIAGVALAALAAHGAAHGRVTFDGQGGHTGGYKPTSTATAHAPSDDKPAAATPTGYSKEYLQKAADPNRFGRHMISVDKAAELLKNMKEENEQMNEKITSKDIKMAVGVAKDKRYAGGNMSGAVKTMEKMKPGLSKHPRVQQVLKSTNEGIDFLKIWNSIKPVHEAIKTTHEDPLVVTKDAEGHIHTHANLSVANAIHGTDVKHQAIHTGKPVQGGKFTFELSQHHEGALKEDAPFDPVAHKKELDQLMGKHMAAHTETTKLINAKAPQEAINKAQERNNAIKQEIRNHKDKVPKGPAPKPGSAADYYAGKKPGEYTGD